MAGKVFAQNRRATFDYAVLETYETGIVLSGAEVKAVRGGLANLKGSYISVRNEQVTIRKFHISPYQIKNQPGYEPTRDRRLLLKKNEIAELIGRADQEKAAIIPLEVFEKKGFIKVKIGICKARKKFDKRQYLKKKSDMREIKQAMR